MMMLNTTVTLPANVTSPTSPTHPVEYLSPTLTYMPSNPVVDSNLTEMTVDGARDTEIDAVSFLGQVSPSFHFKQGGMPKQHAEKTAVENVIATGKSVFGDRPSDFFNESAGSNVVSPLVRSDEEDVDALPEFIEDQDPEIMIKGSPSFLSTATEESPSKYPFSPLEKGHTEVQSMESYARNTFGDFERRAEKGRMDLDVETELVKKYKEEKKRMIERMEEVQEEKEKAIEREGEREREREKMKSMETEKRNNEKQEEQDVVLETRSYQERRSETMGRMEQEKVMEFNGNAFLGKPSHLAIRNQAVDFHEVSFRDIPLDRDEVEEDSEKYGVKKNESHLKKFSLHLEALDVNETGFASGDRLTSNNELLSASSPPPLHQDVFSSSTSTTSLSSLPLNMPSTVLAGVEPKATSHVGTASALYTMPSEQPSPPHTTPLHSVATSTALSPIPVAENTGLSHVQDPEVGDDTFTGDPVEVPAVRPAILLNYLSHSYPLFDPSQPHALFTSAEEFENYFYADMNDFIRRLKLYFHIENDATIRLDNLENLILHEDTDLSRENYLDNFWALRLALYPHSTEPLSITLLVQPYSTQLKLAELLERANCMPPVETTWQASENIVDTHEATEGVAMASSSVSSDEVSTDADLYGDHLPSKLKKRAFGEEEVLVTEEVTSEIIEFINKKQKQEQMEEEPKE